jgi:branched-chain amino acid transport system substrate-binding protein
MTRHAHACLTQSRYAKSRCDKSRARLGGILLSAAAAVVVSACAQSGLDQGMPQTASIGARALTAAKPSDAKAKAVKIALILPLGGYGEPAQIARGMKQAAEMALFEADNPAIQLMTKDDGGTPAGAMAAADAAIADGAEIILGPLFGKSASAVAPIASRANVPVIAFSNDPTVAGHGVYLMSFLASEEVNRVVSYASGQGKKRFAALIPDTAYGKTIEPAFRSAVAKSGGDLVAVETYSADASGMLASAKKVVEIINTAEATGAPVDALFVPAGQDQLSQLGPLLSYSGLTTGRLKLLGTSAWDVPILTRDDALIGGWYAASDPAGWTTFAEKYRRTFGTAPPRLATLSYDAMTMALALSANPGPARFSSENLTRSQGFNGVGGVSRLTADGLSSRGLAVLEIEKYRTTVIDAAPQIAAPQAIATSTGVPSRL